MKTNTSNTKRNGFTLIEMVGVLAVIAILAALLVPKIFAAINDSRLSNSVGSVNTAKTATMNYFGKEGTFGTAAVPDFGATLLTKGLLEQPFTTKVGVGTVAIVLATAGVGAPTASNSAYDLDGDGANDAGSSTIVVQAVLADVALQDAWEIGQRIDGAGIKLTPADATVLDIKGRVKYAKVDPTTVYIYMADK